jgi:predicted enzyme related to lactoylglutathione lyase
MERVLGIGGYFMRAADPAALSAWYRDCLGLDADENGLWRQGAGLTVFATFESETDYFGSRAQQTMLNFRVRDLDAMLAQLRFKGADVAKETQDMEGVGRFGWVTDPEQRLRFVTAVRMMPNLLSTAHPSPASYSRTS